MEDETQPVDAPEAPIEPEVAPEPEEAKQAILPAGTIVKEFMQNGIRYKRVAQGNDSTLDVRA